MIPVDMSAQLKLTMQTAEEEGLLRLLGGGVGQRSGRSEVEVQHLPSNYTPCAVTSAPEVQPVFESRERWLLYASSCLVMEKIFILFYQFVLYTVQIYIYIYI